MSTPNIHKIESDLAFLKETLAERNKQQYASIAIAILWAVIVSLGCMTNDFFHQYSGWYWLCAPPVGFLLSFYFGSKAARKAGVSSKRDTRAHLFHWGSMFFLFLAVLSIAHVHNLSGSVVGQISILIGGLAWYLAGLHLDKRFLLPGIVMVVGAVSIDHISLYPWTVVGLTFSASLIISAIKMRPQHENA